MLKKTPASIDLGEENWDQIEKEHDLEMDLERQARLGYSKATVQRSQLITAAHLSRDNSMVVQRNSMPFNQGKYQAVAPSYKLSGGKVQQLYKRENLKNQQSFRDS